MDSENHQSCPQAVRVYPSEPHEPRRGGTLLGMGTMKIDRKKLLSLSITTGRSEVEWMHAEKSGSKDYEKALDDLMAKCKQRGQELGKTMDAGAPIE